MSFLLSQIWVDYEQLCSSFIALIVPLSFVKEIERKFYPKAQLQCGH